MNRVLDFLETAADSALALFERPSVLPGIQLQQVCNAQYADMLRYEPLCWGCCASPFGELFIVYNSYGICQLGFSQQRDVPVLLARAWPGARLKMEKAQAMYLLQQVFGLRPTTQALVGWVKCTPFQYAVWQALLQIPAGSFCSYTQLANELGNAKACRSVASAIAKNPLGFMVPCHRVIRQSGDLGDYHWGRQRKAELLAWETEHFSAPCG